MGILIQSVIFTLNMGIIEIFQTSEIGFKVNVRLSISKWNFLTIFNTREQFNRVLMVLCGTFQLNTVLKNKK